MTITSEKILRNIKESRISPAPRWQFSIKNSAFWTMFGAALLVGSLSFSVIVDLLVNYDWDIYNNLHKTFLQYLILSLPYLWIVCAIIFSALSYFYFVHTRGWYRHRSYRVVSASVLLTAVLGTAFFFLGLGNKIDQALASKIPYYYVLNADKKKIWTHPDEGLLGGEVIKIPDNNEFILKDYSGKEWDVEKSPVGKVNATVHIGEKVKVIGEVKNRQTFEAKEIRRWEAPTGKEKTEDMD